MIVIYFNASWCQFCTAFQVVFKFGLRPNDGFSDLLTAIDITLKSKKPFDELSTDQGLPEGHSIP